MRRIDRTWRGASIAALALTLAIAGRAPAGEVIRWAQVVEVAAQLPADLPKDDTLALDALEARAGEVLGKLEHPTDRESWQQAAPQLRIKLKDAIGYYQMPPPGVLKVTSVGTVDRGDYVIEKLTYQTLRDIIIPVHVYRQAKVTGRLPAILFVPGHWWADSKTHPDFQAFCINMARSGFVVLTYDPIGQGERGVSFREHRRTSSLLVGFSQQAVMVYESQCALEYLLSRDDVDPEKIGITGASGGGYNSWTMTALDPRIACSVPVVGTSDFLLQIHITRPLDWYQAKEHCHFIPGLLKFANNHEYLAMAAPRPVMILAAHNDPGFAVEGNRRIVSYGRKLYDALGEPERLAYFEDEQFGHGYQQPKRERAYGWFRRWLQDHGSGGPLKEPPTETAPWDAAELRCFPPGENRSAGPGIMAHVRRLSKGLISAPKKKDPVKFRQQLAKVLGMPEQAPAAMIRYWESRLVSQLTLTPFQVRTADGVRLPGMLVSKTDRPRGYILALADDGQPSLLQRPDLQTAVDTGLMALAMVDVRGCGRLRMTKPGWTFATSLLLGENYVGRAALDLSAVRPLLAKRWQTDADKAPEVGLVAVGPHSCLAASYAGALDPQFAWFALEGGFESFHSFIDRPKSLPKSYTLAAAREQAWENIDREIPAHLIPFGALEHFDLWDLLLRPDEERPALLHRSINGDWELLNLGGAPLPRYLEPFDPSRRRRVIGQGMSNFLLAMASDH